GPGKAEIVDLDRARPLGECACAFKAEIAIEVDQDVDTGLFDQPRNVEIRFLPNDVEAVEGGHEPLAHVATVVGPGGKGMDFEAGPVVAFEQLRGEVSRGFLAEFAGNISETYLVGRSVACQASPWHYRRITICGEHLRTA